MATDNGWEDGPAASFAPEEPAPVEQSTVQRLSCGCCPQGCVCHNHMDIPGLVQPQICANHSDTGEVQVLAS